MNVYILFGLVVVFGGACGGLLHAFSSQYSYRLNLESSVGGLEVCVCGGADQGITSKE